MKNELIAARDRTMDLVNAKWNVLARVENKQKGEPLANEVLQLSVLNGIGAELQRYQNLRGYPQERIAESLGIGQASVSRHLSVIRHWNSVLFTERMDHLDAGVYTSQ